MTKHYMNEEDIIHKLKHQCTDQQTWIDLYNYCSYNDVNNFHDIIISASKQVFDNVVKNCYFNCLMCLNNMKCLLTEIFPHILKIYQESSMLIKKKCSNILVKDIDNIPESYRFEIYLVSMLTNNVKSMYAIKELLESEYVLNDEEFKYILQYIDNIDIRVCIAVNKLIEILILIDVNRPTEELLITISKSIHNMPSYQKQVHLIKTHLHKK
jgi:hypothetical protein